MKLTFRPVAPADHDFIAATWSSSWSRPHEAGCLTPLAWRRAVYASVPDILAHPDVRSLVAADTDTTDHVADLFGWVAWRPRAVECVVNGYTRRPTYRLVAGGPMPLLFGLYVKRDYRGHGIARGLLRAAGIDLRQPLAYVCHTRAADRLSEAGKIPQAIWCPSLGRLPHERTHGTARPEADHDADAA